MTKIELHMPIVKGMIKRLNNNTPWQRAVGTYLVKEQRRNFILQGRPQHWKSIIAQKFGNFKILMSSGMLKNSLTWKPVDKWGIKVGTNLIYARTHQYGREFSLSKPLIVRVRRTKKYLVIGPGRHKIPARPFLTIIKEFVDTIKFITMGWLVKGAPHK